MTLAYYSIRRRKSDLKSEGKLNIVIGIFNFLFIGIISPLTILNGAALSREYHIGLFSHFPQSLIFLPLECLLFLIVFDFLFYLYHRYLHGDHHLGKIFHQQHHNTHNLNWSLALRLHFLDFLIFQFIKCICAFILGISLSASIFVDFFLVFYLFYIHQNSTSSKHFFHHSSVEQGRVGNFALIFSFFDDFFKTSIENSKGASLELATEKLSNKAFINEILQLLFGPFRELYNYVKRSRNST